jgi:hypothetical protein
MQALEGRREGRITWWLIVTFFFLRVGRWIDCGLGLAFLPFWMSHSWAAVSFCLTDHEPADRPHTPNQPASLQLRLFLRQGREGGLVGLLVLIVRYNSSKERGDLHHQSLAPNIKKRE